MPVNPIAITTYPIRHMGGYKYLAAFFNYTPYKYPFSKVNNEVV